MTTSPRQLPAPRTPSRRGVTLVEAMMLMVVMSVITLGTGVALRSLIKVPEQNNRVLAVNNLIIDKMEYLRSLGFTALSAMTTGTDSPTIDGITYTRTWTITVNPGGTYNANFLQLSVTIGTQTMTTAVCKQ